MASSAKVKENPESVFLKKKQSLFWRVRGTLSPSSYRRERHGEVRLSRTSDTCWERSPIRRNEPLSNIYRIYRCMKAVVFSQLLSAMIGSIRSISNLSGCLSMQQKVETRMVVRDVVQQQHRGTCRAWSKKQMSNEKRDGKS